MKKKINLSRYSFPAPKILNSANIQANSHAGPYAVCITGHLEPDGQFAVSGVYREDGHTLRDKLLAMTNHPNNLMKTEEVYFTWHNYASSQEAFNAHCTVWHAAIGEPVEMHPRESTFVCPDGNCLYNQMAQALDNRLDKKR